LSVIYQKPSTKFIKPFEHFNIQRFFYILNFHKKFFLVKK